MISQRKFALFVIALSNGERNGSDVGSRLDIALKDAKEEKKLIKFNQDFLPSQ